MNFIIFINNRKKRCQTTKTMVQSFYISLISHTRCLFLADHRITTTAGTQRSQMSKWNSTFNNNLSNKIDIQFALVMNIHVLIGSYRNQYKLKHISKLFFTLVASFLCSVIPCVRARVVLLFLLLQIYCRVRQTKFQNKYVCAYITQFDSDVCLFVCFYLNRFEFEFFFGIDLCLRF